MYAPPARLLLALLQLLASARPALGAAAGSPPPILPSHAAARRNAYRIFNAVESAGRQWGSSVDHNGLSFFRVTVPEGNYFFHGSSSPDRPVGLEWLAFEIEHSQIFATSWEPRNQWDGQQQQQQQQQQPLGAQAVQDVPQSPIWRNRPPTEPTRAYLQTYRAARPLNLLYIDGMSAAKSDYGTNDSLDFILRGLSPDRVPNRDMFADDLERAEALCNMSIEWERAGGVRIDGFMRMEAGFEIIYCRFEDGGGLDLVDVDASPFSNETGWIDSNTRIFEYMRACSLRYHGFSEDRMSIDWSGMASAFFYDMNLTNPDASRPELPRLVNMTSDERRAVKTKVQEAFSKNRSGQHGKLTIDWRGAVDALVVRYADRLDLISSGDLTPASLRSEVNFLLYPYMDFRNPGAAPSLERCRTKHLEPALAHRSLWTEQDALIHAAIEAVAGDMCATLREAWEALGGRGAADDVATAAAAALEMVRGLKTRLAWSTWRGCGGRRCASSGEICVVSMFPMGDVEDHFAPRCKNNTGMWNWTDGRGYWGPWDWL